MNWINIKDKQPSLYDKVVLAVETHRSRRLFFWKKKMIVYGWLDQAIDTLNGYEFRYYDYTNDCHRKESVTHWMELPEPPQLD